MKEKILVVGAGRWGTSMAIYLGNLGYEVALCCRDKEKASLINNQRYSPNLKDWELPSTVNAISMDDELPAPFAYAFLSTPVRYLEDCLRKLKNVDGNTVYIGINKGIEYETLRTPPQIFRHVFPTNPYAHLGGPCFPEGVISTRLPAAETLACGDYELGLNLQKKFSSPSFRIYLSRDAEGVALLGAMKNVYAIGAGIIEGLEFNEEAMAILITRTLAELRKFSRMMLIPEETLYGLSGLGDIVLTCYSRQSSQNKNFGKMLAVEGSVEKVMELMGNKAAEGYYTLASIKKIKDRYGLEMPLADTIYEVVYMGKSPAEAIQSLMNRPLKMED